MSYTTSVADVVAFVRKAKAQNRKIIAAIAVAGNNIGYEHGRIETLAMALGDAETYARKSGLEGNIGDIEMTAELSVGGLSAKAFQFSGLPDLFLSEQVVKVGHDWRRTAVALESQFNAVRPRPAVDTQLMDVFFRKDTKGERLERLRDLLHPAVYQAPSLQTALSHCVRVLSLREVLSEQELPWLKSAQEQSSTVVRQAEAVYGLYKFFEDKYRRSHSVAWGELDNWTSNYVSFYATALPRQGVSGQMDGANGPPTAFYTEQRHILPLAIMPRRAALGDGTQFQVGRTLTVDQHTIRCLGCLRHIGPINDTFNKGSNYCFVCEVLKRTHMYRAEEKEKKASKRDRPAEGDDASENSTGRGALTADRGTEAADQSPASPDACQKRPKKKRHFRRTSYDNSRARKGIRIKRGAHNLLQGFTRSDAAATVPVASRPKKGRIKLRHKK